MNIINTHSRILVALLFVGGAILFNSCKGRATQTESERKNIITLQGDSITNILTENGHRKYQLKSPIIEQYGLADEPYTEFREGIALTTYKDTTLAVSSTLVADYAILFEKQELWEAKGNVVVTNAEGRVLRTEQLFWNQKTEKIYSNVESKIDDGDNTIIGIGFEADQEFEDYTMRRPKGRLLIDTKPVVATDTTKVDSISNK